MKNPDWSDRERFIHAQCSIAENLRERLPSPSQLFGWRIHCGVIPSNGSDDLKSLWNAFYGDAPMPTGRMQLEKALRRYLGQQRPGALDVQLVQIKREAGNLGFKLPKHRERGASGRIGANALTLTRDKRRVSVGSIPPDYGGNMLRAESNNIAETVATVNSPREQLLDKRGVARLSQSTPRSVENWMGARAYPIPEDRTPCPFPRIRRARRVG